MNIEDIKTRLLVKYPSFCSIILSLNIIEKNTIEKADTDGQSIYYNPNFLETITDEQKIFIFAHEICHIAFNHISRGKRKNKVLWNMATDAVINALLKQDGLPLVEGAIDIPYAVNHDAEEIYENLLKEEKNASIKKITQNCYDIGHDTHLMWNNKVKKTKTYENSNTIFRTDEIQDLGEKEIFKQNKLEREKEIEKLKISLVNQSCGYGDDTDSELRNIDDIDTLDSLIDWRRLLRQNLMYYVDWSYQNATIENGIICPYLEEYTIAETEILLDTSGSVDDNLLRNFLRECKNIIKISKIKVGCFDTKFYGFTEINKISDIDRIKFYGGGGTNFDVAIDAFTKRTNNKIIFTDGFAELPKKSINAIWIVYSNIKINPIGGRVIYINEDYLENLCNYANNRMILKK